MHPWLQMSDIYMRADSMRQSCFLTLSVFALRFPQYVHAQADLTFERQNSAVQVQMTGTTMLSSRVQDACAPSLHIRYAWNNYREQLSAGWMCTCATPSQLVALQQQCIQIRELEVCSLSQAVKKKCSTPQQAIAIAAQVRQSRMLLLTRCCLLLRM